MPSERIPRQVERQEKDYELFSTKNWRRYKRTPNGKFLAEQLREDPELALIQKKINHRLFELFVLYSLENSWVPKVLGVGVSAWLGGMNGGISAWLGGIAGGEHIDAMLGVVGGIAGGKIVSLGASQIARMRVGYYAKHYSQVMMHCLGDLISRIEREEVTGTFAEHLDRFQPCLSSVPLISLRRLFGNAWVITHDIDSIQQLARKIVRTCLRTSKDLKKVVRAAKVHDWQTRREKISDRKKQLEDMQRKSDEQAATSEEMRERQRQHGQLLTLVAGQVARKPGSSQAIPIASASGTLNTGQTEEQFAAAKDTEDEVCI